MSATDKPEPEPNIAMGPLNRPTPVPTPWLKTMAETPQTVDFGGNHDPNDNHLSQDYPIALIGVDAHGCSLIDGAFLGSQTVAYAGAIKEANRLMAAGGWERIYILVPSEYCCEMRDGKPTMVKHHLGEE
jgi:hypothetical protein